MKLKKSLENRCFCGALALTLILPDICGSAEYPDKNVTDRYIGWCEKYVCPNFIQTPEESWTEVTMLINGADLNKRNVETRKELSGEAIYNLRNKFLHQGEPKIVSEEIRNPENRIDRFLLDIGKNSVISEMTWSLSWEDGRSYKVECINIHRLCKIIAESAEQYYSENQDKFSFNFKIADLSIPEKQRSEMKESGNVVPVEEAFQKYYESPEFLDFINRFINHALDDMKSRTIS